MPRSQLLIDLEAVPRPDGMPVGLRFRTHLRPGCFRELAVTDWSRVELPGSGWVVQADGDDAELAALEAATHVIALGSGDATTPVRAADRASVQGWLARRGAQVTVSDLVGATVKDVAAMAARGALRGVPRA